MNNIKLQIRTIKDINGNVYNIYDIMSKTHLGVWISIQDYYTLEDALEWHDNIEIEDLSNTN